MITPENFQCTFCGKCCMHYTVKLSEKDIKRIEGLGFQKDSFARKDDFDEATGKYALRKQENGWGVFLRKEGEKFLCSIHSARPDICRKYPFFEKKEIDTCIPVLE